MDLTLTYHAFDGRRHLVDDFLTFLHNRRKNKSSSIKMFHHKQIRENLSSIDFNENETTGELTI